MGIITSKFSALSIFIPLIFETQLINGSLFLNATALFFFALSGSVIVVVPFTTICVSLKSHKSYLNIEVLIRISLLTL